MFLLLWFTLVCGLVVGLGCFGFVRPKMEETEQGVAGTLASARWSAIIIVLTIFHRFQDECKSVTVGLPFPFAGFRLRAFRSLLLALWMGRGREEGQTSNRNPKLMSLGHTRSNASLASECQSSPQRPDHPRIQLLL